MYDLQQFMIILCYNELCANMYELDFVHLYRIQIKMSKMLWIVKNTQYNLLSVDLQKKKPVAKWSRALN